MEKVCWKVVRHNDKGGHLPNLRWGHSCTIIDDQVIFFGGYADSNYMNDLWSFNTITMEWNEINTTGDVPSYRSNCTMHYDKGNERLILFGGGGANKQRFNSINVLDWKTKEWLQINPKQNEAAPWARTYHTSELFYPYLVIHGGEGISDLDDLWIFNFLTMSWIEVPIAPNAVRPCARRFHSSARVGTQFFVIAGCYSKYRCLSDIWSIDLKSFLLTGSLQDLKWKQRKMKDNTFLTRWGHTSAVYDDKIYVFGGRFCNDLNDILILDPQKDVITTARTYGQLPKARRRHSSCFLGNSMLIFGGFNGQYFNDLYYISFPKPQKKFYVSSKLTTQNINTLKSIKNLEWIDVQTSEGTTTQLCKGLIASRFQSNQSLNNFIRSINQQLSKAELQKLIECLYRGYGRVDPQLIYQHGINIFDSKEEMHLSFLKSVSQQRQSILPPKKLRQIQSVVVLQDYHFRAYLQQQKNMNQFTDVTFNLHNQYYLTANKALLAIHSQYFSILVSQQFIQNQQTIPIPFSDNILFEVLINFLMTGFVVTSKIYSHEFWVMLAEMAEYYSLQELLDICEHQLIAKITQTSCHQLLVIALEMQLTELSRACGQQIIRNMISQQKQEVNEVFPQIKNQQMNMQRQQVLKEVYNTLRFDILQKKIDSEQKEVKNNLKKIDSVNNQNQQQQKQNNQLSN